MKPQHYFMIPTFPTIISYFHIQNISVNWLPNFYLNMSYMLLISCLCSLPFPVWNAIDLVLIHLSSTFLLGATSYGPIIKKTFHIKPVPSPGPGTGISLISLNENIDFYLNQSTFCLCHSCGIFLHLLTL